MKQKSLKFWHSLDKHLCKDSAFALILLLIIFYFASGNPTFIQISAILSILAMIWPDIFKPFAFIWFGLAKALGLFVPKIVLSIIFILVVLPVGLFRKIIGKDDMLLKKWKKGSESVFLNRDHTYSPQDLDHPF